MRSMKWVGLGAAALLALTACTGSAQSGEDSAGGETYELEYATYITDNGFAAVTFQMWADAVEEKTDGRVKINMHYAGSLLPAQDILKGVEDGRADMGFAASVYSTAELPLTQLASVPFTSDSFYESTVAYSELYQSNEDLQEEYHRNGVHLLTVVPLSPNIIISKEELPNLESLANKRMRSAGYFDYAVEAADAIPVAVGGGADVYEAFERGTVDAVTVFPIDAAVDFGFADVADHFTFAGTGPTAMTANVINLDLWNSLPEDIQQAIEEVNAEDIERQFDTLAEWVQTRCDTAADDGVQISALSEADVEKWRDALGTRAVDEWKAGVTTADADAFYNEYSELVSGIAPFDDGVEGCLTQ